MLKVSFELGSNPSFHVELMLCCDVGSSHLGGSPRVCPPLFQHTLACSTVGRNWLTAWVLVVASPRRSHYVLKRSGEPGDVLCDSLPGSAALSSKENQIVFGLGGI